MPAGQSPNTASRCTADRSGNEGPSGAQHTTAPLPNCWDLSSRVTALKIEYGWCWGLSQADCLRSAFDTAQRSDCCQPQGTTVYTPDCAHDERKRLWSRQPRQCSTACCRDRRFPSGDNQCLPFGVHSAATCLAGLLGCICPALSPQRSGQEHGTGRWAGTPFLSFTLPADAVMGFKTAFRRDRLLLVGRQLSVCTNHCAHLPGTALLGSVFMGHRHLHA